MGYNGEPEIIVLRESRDVTDSVNGIIRVESILTSTSLYFYFFLHDSEVPFTLYDFVEGSSTHNEMLTLIEEIGQH